MSAQARGRSSLTRPVAYRLTPKQTAAARASNAACVSGWRSPGRAGASSRDEPASQIPSAIAPSTKPAPGSSASPAATATSAASAPSVEMIGATTPARPCRRARYERSRPATLPTPAAQSRPTSPALSDSGRSTSAGGSVSASPIISTQASRWVAGIRWVARAFSRVAPAKPSAAPRPPSTAIIEGAAGSPGAHGHRQAAARRERGHLADRQRPPGLGELEREAAQDRLRDRLHLEQAEAHADARP